MKTNLFVKPLLGATVVFSLFGLVGFNTHVSASSTKQAETAFVKTVKDSDSVLNYQKSHSIGTLTHPDNNFKRAQATTNYYYVFLPKAQLTVKYMSSFVSSTTNSQGHGVFTKTAAKYAALHISKDAKISKAYFEKHPKQLKDGETTGQVFGLPHVQNNL